MIAYLTVKVELPEDVSAEDFVMDCDYSFTLDGEEIETEIVDHREEF